ncbi:unnamed protein product [Meloidogyne enterolobii]|uniref:Uncharacterized protein n=1 Tax=Meloidogyne enterolobii TaxID=390850 RepID=A0ACB0ZU63_MELEN
MEPSWNELSFDLSQRCVGTIRCAGNQNFRKWLKSRKSEIKFFSEIEIPIHL